MEKIKELLKPFIFTFMGDHFNLEFDINSYHENGSIMIRLKKRKNEKICFPFTTFSMNIEGLKLEKYEFVVENSELHIDLIKFFMEETKYFLDTGKGIETQYGFCPVWKFNI